MKYSKGKRLVELGLTGFAYQSTATPTSPKTGVCVWQSDGRISSSFGINAKYPDII